MSFLLNLFKKKEEKKIEEQINVVNSLKDVDNLIGEICSCPVCFEQYSEERPRAVLNCSCGKRLCFDCACQIINDAAEEDEPPRCPQCRDEFEEKKLDFDYGFKKEIEQITRSVSNIAEEVGIRNEQDQQPVIIPVQPGENIAPANPCGVEPLPELPEHEQPNRLVNLKPMKMIQRRDKEISKVRITTERPYEVNEGAGGKSVFRCKCGYKCKVERTMIGHIFTVHFPVSYENMDQRNR